MEIVALRIRHAVHLRPCLKTNFFFFSFFFNFILFDAYIYFIIHRRRSRIHPAVARASPGKTSDDRENAIKAMRVLVPRARKKYAAMISAFVVARCFYEPIGGSIGWASRDA